ncbi:hypothetical protein AYR62_11300 [Secundilactobacillus paracollinoides]|uniref:DUF4811 domain-containing protein n=1 Tax=Secundilactobacillus paracollinoides TaxID=240427 RepID=A0A1B2IY04_9LACO|nr:DUF4811 domain-containing protein [Secundilactobacillus paracollinoides]ANZ64607.1 hypothetical protein AYR62_11300 [Secundilactobacillus paracollinoides]ANZ66888.1 hypothetical protein AYR63_06905 [Secundilactobacillus paracollinoides]KRL79567.1 hypothetical protein FC17_GL000395 [Secundilactobacillus paracollinoides DSM 15502 = JCM 11969]
MIIFILAICVVLAYICFIYIQSKSLSAILAIVFLAGAVVSGTFIVKNWHDHYGLKEVTTTSAAKTIYPASSKDGMNTMLYSPIGTENKHQVYVYKKTADAKKTSHTQVGSTTKNEVIRTSGKSRIVTKTTRYAYKNNADKIWFAFTDQSGQYVRRVNKIYINKNWIVLSAAQATALKKEMSSKSFQANLKTQAKTYVAAQVKAAMTKDPTMGKAALAKVEKQAAAEFQQQAVAKVIKQVKAKY